MSILQTWRYVAKSIFSSPRTFFTRFPSGKDLPEPSLFASGNFLLVALAWIVWFIMPAVGGGGGVASVVSIGFFFPLIGGVIFLVSLRFLFMLYTRTIHYILCRFGGRGSMLQTSHSVGYTSIILGIWALIRSAAGILLLLYGRPSVVIMVGSGIVPFLVCSIWWIVFSVHGLSRAHSLHPAKVLVSMTLGFVPIILLLLPIAMPVGFFVAMPLFLFHFVPI